MMSLTSIRNLIVDMDGVLWHGNRALPGLADFFNVIRARDIRFVLATNNSSKTAHDYALKLREMGVEVREEEILTTAQATADYLKQMHGGGKVFVIGEDGLKQALMKNGFVLCDLYETGADIVVCGMDRDLSWHKLATATLNIRAGADFVGTNPDPTFPIEQGIVHGNGAILAALQIATGKLPFIVGKPQPLMYLQALSSLGNDNETTIAIGDRMETDILGAVRAGIKSILVLSGVSTIEQLPAYDYQPTWVMKDLFEISDFLRNL